MRRKLVPVSFSFCIGIVLGTKLYDKGCFWLLMFLMAIVIIILYCGKGHFTKRVVCPFLVVVLVSASYCNCCLQKLQVQADSITKSNKTEGVIIAAEEISGGGGVNYTVKNHNGKILVKIYDNIPDFRSKLGKKMIINKQIELPDTARNPRCFDYRFFLMTKGITGIVKPDNSEYIIGEIESRALYYSGKTKELYYNRISKEVNASECSILMGIMFGEKNGIDQEIYSEFQNNSTVHILAVSGLHMGIIYAIIVKLLGKRNSCALTIIKLICLMAYIFLAGFSPSVIRASMMIGLHILSGPLRMRYDLLSAACFCGLVMLIINPLYLFNIGFQMSFVAILSIAVILMRFQGISNICFVSTICVQMGINPIIMYNFNYISVLSFLANPPIICLAGFIVPLGIISLICLPFSDYVGLCYAYDFVCYLLEIVLKLLVKVNHLLGMGGMGFMYCTSPKNWQLILYYSFIVLLFREGFVIDIKRKRYMKLLIIIMLIFSLSLLIGIVDYNIFDKAEVVFVDVGQGDCLHIKAPNGMNILIDGGGSYYRDIGNDVLMPYFLKNGIKKIDLAIISHLHLDHYGGIATLGNYVPVEKVAIYQGYKTLPDNISEILGNYKNSLIFLEQGQTIEMTKDLKIEVIYPKKIEIEGGHIPDIKDENEMSLILKVTYCDLSILMTADIDEKGELELVRQMRETLNSNVLKVSHHGSKYSSTQEFIDAVNPNAAIIQVGKNNFGHPAESTIEKFKKKCIMVYRNDENGAVCIFGIKEGEPEIAVMID